MKIYNINPGIVAEWMSLIDPNATNDKDYEQKLAAVLKSQAELLLNSEMTEIKARHWILSKHSGEDGSTIIEFSLIAYSAKAEVPACSEQEFNARKIKLLKENLRNAIEQEDYLKAAEVRDLLRSLEEQKGAA